jgi:hypothetical protein
MLPHLQKYNIFKKNLMIMTIVITWFAFIMIHLLQTYLQVCSPPSMPYSHKHHMFKHMNFFAMDALRVVLTIKKQMMKNKIQQG